MKKLAKLLVRWALYAVGACVVLLFLFVLGYALLARNRLPDLHAWHTMVLQEEFKAQAPGAPKSFTEYKSLEEKLFAELRRRLLDDPTKADSFALSRYHPGSVPAHLAYDTPYNRSFELVPPAPKGSVLLVHGLSDSPYMMRTLASLFYDRGYYVLSLRLPGHGTLPSGLLRVTWQDWYGAVALAARHAAQQGGADKPFIAGGFSTGAALVTLFALRSLDDASLRRPSRLFLVSPAIGITPLAVLTHILPALSFIPGFEKSRWTDVLPEYDPYKYNSFPVNAGNQIYRLTKELNRTLLAEKERQRLQGMPKVCVFQSLVDATVTPAEVVHGLLGELPGAGNELIVFDVNRQDALEGLLAQGPVLSLKRLRGAEKLPFRLTVVSNSGGSTSAVAAYTREAGATDEQEAELGLEWPRGVVSLGHVALPFPSDDPIYGLTPRADEVLRYGLGAFDARGESGALVVPLGALARLRSNPFFDVIRTTIAADLSTDDSSRLTLDPGAPKGSAPPPPEGTPAKPGVPPRH